MRKVNKAEEPQALTAWRKRNPNKHTYADLANSECRAIRTRCIEEQKGLCAFCCERISLDASHNAHLLSQRRYPQHSLDHRNIVASCESGENCGKFQGTKELPLTPLMEECETELKFALSGRVNALSERAQQTIDALNLNAPGLCQRRRKAIRDMELEPDFHPVDAICTWDAELLNYFIDSFSQERDGELVAYAPVLVNIAKQYLFSFAETDHAQTLSLSNRSD